MYRQAAVAPLHQPLFTDSFLASHLAAEYAKFRDSEHETGLLPRLRHWATKDFQKEISAENDFIDIFFKQTWDYWGSGTRAKTEGYNLYPKFPISRSGQGGGTGIADLAMGWFGRPTIAETPQAICEFKDIRSGLDKPQRRKGNDRSPIQQCADYLKEAASRLFGNEPIQPTWALVSDMNEFRLYWRKTMPSQFQRFFIRAPVGENAVALVDEGEEARFQRFLFWKLLRGDMVLSLGGPSRLEKLLTEQGIHEHAIENSFYQEYKSYRELIFRVLVDSNPTFKGTRGKLVRLTQRFLDRCLFILFCEDMGGALNFPPSILRDLLIRESIDPTYDSDDVSVWHKVKRLFVAMRDGTPFGDAHINHFNGGLFADEPELEGLAIPNRIFCAKGQGAAPGSLVATKETLLFFAAHYNFGIRGASMERSIGLYTLGRIFEQSITDLEFMEAKADGRPSLSEISKRKRDGVYYTPEWVTFYLVEETLGAHILDLRRKYDLDDGPTFTAEELDKYQLATQGKRRSGGRAKPPESVINYLARLDAYAEELAQIKVLDPACGSGAFLIQALDRLVRERSLVTEERERVTVSGVLFDRDKVTKAVLTENLYGVDLNEESVEITRLAIWLRSALPDRRLCALDDNIRCGNSLVGPDFYHSHQLQMFTESQRERINVFDWRAAFPQVFQRAGASAGFDCIIGNPPYVKLQNFRQVDPDVCQYLSSARGPDGQPLYESTQTQNFDLYLPFIEKGMELLNENGRMGFIAPSLWLMNEYGLGLRRKLLSTHRLERWVDFKDFQVFEEAITYTALQFFRGKPRPAISCRFAPDGNVAGTEWSQPDALITYASLSKDGAWRFLPSEERALLDRLKSQCDHLGAEHAIVVGIQTSADHIYHLERIGAGRYCQRVRGATPREVNIEDGIMRPVISGDEAKRYVVPSTNTFLLFPYDDSGDHARLFGATEMVQRFPLAWEYLRGHEEELRARERRAFDDEDWYRFGRNQNIDKQKLSKLSVAQTVPGMRVSFDQRGQFCFNNVRVNGILVDDEKSGFFLLGVLNSAVVDFVFRRIAKPKEGGYFEANKQFISPLPIPRTTEAQRSAIGQQAKELQLLYTNRVRLMEQIDRRLNGSQTHGDVRAESWLWAEVGDVTGWKKKAPTALALKERTAWAKARLAESVLARLEQIDIRMHAGAVVIVREDAGELRVDVDGIPIISGVFVDSAETPFIAAQWRHKLRRTKVTAAFKAKQLVDMLLNLRACSQQALKHQVVELDAKVQSLEDEIENAEQAMNDMLYAIYALTKIERELVEGDRRRFG